MFKKIIAKIKANKLVIDTYCNLYSRIISLFIKRIDKKSFKERHREMRELYLTNKEKYDFLSYVMPEWKENMIEIEKYFLNDFSISFLRHPIISKTMFLYTFRGWKNVQKALISSGLTKQKARHILREYNIGRPLLSDLGYATSSNSIHHLYHILKFFKETNTKVSDFDTVVEVGGGYGNLAKIFKSMNSKSTYIIIDIPIFSYLQAVYLKTIFGTQAVNMVHGNDIQIKKGFINIVPLDTHTQKAVREAIIHADLFVSTWALSESNENMQNYITEVDYFKASYLLLAYQKSAGSFAFAENIKNTPDTYVSVYNKETEYIRDNYYLFSKRIQN